MRSPTWLIVALACWAAACAPEDECGGSFYYDGTSCRRCPANSEFEDGTCVCDDSDNYEFVDFQCRLKPGAMPPVEDAGAVTATCSEYCDFQAQCIGANTIATSAFTDLVSGLHADDAEACESACQDDTAGDGADDPIVACIEAGRAASSCDDDTAVAGFTGAMTLIGDCCRGKDEALCESICEVVMANDTLKTMVDFCE